MEMVEENVSVIVNGIRGFIINTEHFVNGIMHHPSKALLFDVIRYGYAGAAKKFPSKGDNNDFARLTDNLQSLVEKEVFFAPEQGDSSYKVWYIFWYTRKPISTKDLIKLLKENGLRVSIKREKVQQN